MEKKRVSVQIEGRSYSLITTDDEKYVQKVANEVLSHIDVYKRQIRLVVRAVSKICHRNVNGSFFVTADGAFLML